MKTQKIRWRGGRGDIAHLRAALRPVRTHREVAALLGASPSLVRALESSALRKIVRALIRHDGEFRNGEPKL